MTGNSELVGDYVLGVLDGDELVAFESALANDDALRLQVAGLRARMRSLDDTAAVIEPNASLWAGIEARIDKLTSTDKVVPIRRRMAMGQMAAIAASLVVAAGLGFTAGRMMHQPAEQPLVIAVLLTDGAEPGVIVEAFANNSVHIRSLEELIAPEGKILEVWTKPSEEIGPVSLGRFTRSGDIFLPEAALPTPHSGQLYEITLEDAPGSPTGKPTGPILVKGFARSPQI